MQWTVRLEGGPRRVNHAAARVAGVVYSLGGYCSSGGFNDDEQLPVYALDVGTLRWRSVRYRRSGHVPRQRYGHTAVAYKNKIYMWGGRDNREAYDTLSVLDVATLEWSTGQISGSVPFAKDGHSACLIGDRMYIFGGFENTTEQYSQVHYLDLRSLSWTLVETRGPAPSPRDFHTAVAVGHRMYIFGGRGDLSLYEHSNSDVYDPDLYYLDTLAGEWVKPAPLGDWPEGRRSHSAWVHEGDMYIFGGYNLHLSTHFNDLYRYSPAEDRWRCVRARGTRPCQRRRSACVTHENKLYLFGGTSPSGSELNETMEEDEAEEEKMVDNSDLHVLDFSPSLRTLSILAVLRLGLDQDSLPWAIKCDIKSMTLPGQISKPVTPSG